MKKIYSAFISSTSKVETYRKIAIETLTDRRFFCHAMEHFTVENFPQIMWRIQVSDFVLLIMGADYGTEDPYTQKSITQMEFEYAKEIGKPVLVIITPELESMLKKKNKSKDEKKQVDFYDSIIKDRDHYSRSITDTLTLDKILNQYLAAPQSMFSGWIRDEIVGRELEDWQKKNIGYDLRGKWYHFHYSDKDPMYFRIGTIDIKQDFNPSGYRTCKFGGKNYGLLFNSDKTEVFVDANGHLKRDKDSQSSWEGEYILQSDELTYAGIYKNERKYEESNFLGEESQNKNPYGMHEFTLELDLDDLEEKTMEFCGMFYDRAPSRKFGRIRVYKSKEARDREVIERLGKVNCKIKEKEYV